MVDGNYIMMQGGGSFVSELRPAAPHSDQDAVTFHSLCVLQTVRRGCSLPRNNTMKDGLTRRSYPIPATFPAGLPSVVVG